MLKYEAVKEHTYSTCEFEFRVKAARRDKKLEDAAMNVSSTSQYTSSILRVKILTQAHPLQQVGFVGQGGLEIVYCFVH